MVLLCCDTVHGFGFFPGHFHLCSAEIVNAADGCYEHLCRIHEVELEGPRICACGGAFSFHRWNRKERGILREPVGSKVEVKVFGHEEDDGIDVGRGLKTCWDCR